MTGRGLILSDEDRANALFMLQAARLFRAIWLYFAGILSVVIVYYLLINVDQGVDVVILAGEYVGHGLSGIAAVCFMSYVLWYSARIISYFRQKKDDLIYDPVTYQQYAIPTKFHQHIPRMLAYNCFVVIQLAIFHLPTVFSLSRVALLLILVAHNGLYFLVSAYFSSPAGALKKKLGVIVLAVLAAYTGFLLFDIVRCGIDLAMKVFHDEPGRHAFWLRLMALLLVGFQIVTVFSLVRRRKKIDAEISRTSPGPNDAGAAVNPDPLQPVKNIGPFGNAEKSYFRNFFVVVVVGGMLYLLAIFFLGIAKPIGPLALALLSFGVLVAAVNLVVSFNIRWSFNFFIILFLAAWLNGMLAQDPYAVRLEETGTTPRFAKRLKPQAYLGEWFREKVGKFSPDSTRKFPVYIVLSNGGASRAGKWVSDVLSHLEDDSEQADKNNTFDQHVLAIAGASGGSVGNCVFYSLLKEKCQGHVVNFTKHSSAFFKSDFLTFTLGRMLGPDILRHVVPWIPMDDRAAALERSLSDSHDSLLNRYFDDRVTNVFDFSGKGPMLYLNSTEVDNGMPGVTSSVKLSEGKSDNTLRTDILSLLDSMAVCQGSGDLRISTAAILSSRFPFVSPAGKVFDRYYVDGGYFDNSGAGTALDLLRELTTFMNQPSNLKLQKEFSFHIIHITNAEVIPKPIEPISPLTNDLLAPVLTLMGMQGSSTAISDEVLQNNFRLFTRDTSNSMIEYSLYNRGYDSLTTDSMGGRTKPKYEETYPMSWVISDYQLDRMEKALERYQVQERKWFWFYLK